MVGLMGVGSPPVGRLVADRLGLTFIDNDELLAARTDRSAEQIAATHGLAELHSIEADVLVRALDQPAPSC